MGFSAGENIYYRLISDIERYSALVVSVDDEHMALRTQNNMPADISEGKYMAISGVDLDYYVEVIGIEENTLRVRQMWGEKREYFRVDDVFPLIAKKVNDTLPYKKSKIFLGYVNGISDIGVPDEAIPPQLWKMLVDINNKLGLILERLYLESEGFIKAENRQVNISASGIRFSMEEHVDVGDIVEVKMLLPTYPSLGILAYGIVVRVKYTNEGVHEVALHFVDMDDEVRDEVIQYTLQRQREIMRKQRQQRDKGDREGKIEERAP